jgi:UDP-galactopyranose mutase
MPVQEFTAPQSSGPTTLVIGAGPVGLSAALHLGPEAWLVDAARRPGGQSRPISEEGFRFDRPGLLPFGGAQETDALVAELLDGGAAWRERSAWVWGEDAWRRVPASVAGGARASRPVVAIDGTRAWDGREGTYEGPERRRRAGSGAREVVGALERRRPRFFASAPQDYEGFLREVWGPADAAGFAIPYARKLWGREPAALAAPSLGSRVPAVQDVLEGTWRPTVRGARPRAGAGFPWPEHGGLATLLDAMARRLGDRLRLDAAVVRFSPARHVATLGDGTAVPYEFLVSTLPLPALVALAGDEAPPRVREAAAGLRARALRLVHLGIGRARTVDAQWLYCPGESLFHRVVFPGAFAADAEPAGGFALTCEIAYDAGAPLPVEGDALVRRCVADCVALGLIDERDPVRCAVTADVSSALPIEDDGRAERVALVRDWLAQHDVVLAGRMAEWQYHGSAQPLLAGREAADRVRTEQARQFLGFGCARWASAR